MLGIIDSLKHSLFFLSPLLQSFLQHHRRVWRGCACGGAAGEYQPDKAQVGVVPSFLKTEGVPFFLCRSVFFFFLSLLLYIKGTSASLLYPPLDYACSCCGGRWSGCATVTLTSSCSSSNPQASCTELDVIDSLLHLLFCPRLSPLQSFLQSHRQVRRDCVGGYAADEEHSD